MDLLAGGSSDQRSRNAHHRHSDRRSRCTARSEYGSLCGCLAATFGIWFASERTLSIHSIRTPKCEAFYWFAILFTFSLGTAAGDLIAEQVDLGYAKSAVLFGVVIAVVAAAHFGLKLNAVLAFWITYVVTRPLGASIGDLLTQDRDEAAWDSGRRW